MKQFRTKPRPHETISIGGRTKWKLDALCALGRRSRTATIDILIEDYLRGKPQLRSAMEEIANQPHPIQWKRRQGDVAPADASVNETSAEDESPAEACERK